VKKQVLIAPGVKKPEAPVRESFDGTFRHLSNSSRGVPQRCAKTPRSDCSTANAPFYRVDWPHQTDSRLTLPPQYPNPSPGVQLVRSEPRTAAVGIVAHSVAASEASAITSAE
jgi:hypothetical protein